MTNRRSPRSHHVLARPALRGLTRRALPFALTGMIGCGANQLNGTSQDPAINSLAAQAGDINTTLKPTGPVLEKDLGIEPRGDFDCQLKEYSLSKIPDEFVLFNPNADVLWPGSLVQGKSIADGVLDPIPVRRASGIVTLALVTGGTNFISRQVDEPSLASITQAQNDILAGFSSATPAKFSYQFDSIYSAEQLSVIANANFKGFGASVAAHFGIDDKDAKSRVLVQFAQEYYTMAFAPPQGAAGAFAPGVTAADLQPYAGPGNPPVYVGSVTYGRIFYLMFESTASQTDLDAAVAGSYDGGFWSLSADLQVKYKSIINNSTVRTFGLGGSAEDAIKSVTGQTTDDTNADKHNIILKFQDFLVKDANFSKNGPGVPVSYSLRYLFDSSAVRLALTTDYTAKNCVPAGLGCDGVPRSGKRWDDCPKPVCGGDGSTCRQPCQPRSIRFTAENCEYVNFYPNKIKNPQPVAHGTRVSFLNGTGENYVFPVCDRVYWKDVAFQCNNGQWTLMPNVSFDYGYSCGDDTNAGADNNVSKGGDQCHGGDIYMGAHGWQYP